MRLESKIEAILFFKGEPVKIKDLASMLSTKEDEVLASVNALKLQLEDRGVRIMQKDDKVMISTAPDMGIVIEKILKEELSRDLGKAGLETLSIVLYRGPVTRSDIDYIRGVNSTFILRNLLIRGLVEKVHNPKDQRSFLYKPTFELLAYLGISDVHELEGYDSVRAEISDFESVVEEDDLPAESTEQAVEIQSESTNQIDPASNTERQADGTGGTRDKID